jgi:hypothetical protein
MAPRHPVPEGYGSPCEEGEWISQGTGSRRGINPFQDEGELDVYHNRRHDFAFNESTSDNMYDEC